MKTPTVKNLTGERFGRWLVVGEGEPRLRANGKKRRRWKCQCNCGQEGLVEHYNLLNGGSLSCGCFKAEVVEARCTKHGYSLFRCPSPEYRTWQAMKNRCANPNYEKFHLYGGRGISVCSRWLDGFENFLADMGERPIGKQTLDRIDSNGNYCPDNCRWASWTEQQNNRGNNKKISWNGKTQTYAEWERELGFTQGLLCSRITSFGWTIEKALTTPKGPSHR